MITFDLIIVGTGPTGLAAAFELLELKPDASILLVDKNAYSSGGLRNDCKMNFTWPIGFPIDSWDESEALALMQRIEELLEPEIKERKNIDRYTKRADKIGVKLLDIRQAHLGTDGGLALIKRLQSRLESHGATFSLGEEITDVDPVAHTVTSKQRTLHYKRLLLAPGRGGFSFLQKFMRAAGISYIDNIVDIGIRVETRCERFPIVNDYYDPKFIFPGNTRTFCCNSGSAFVVQEKYGDSSADTWLSINGHAWSSAHAPNGLVNLALLNTVCLTHPLASGQDYAKMLSMAASLLGGGKPIMQRVGDFRMGKRSTADSFVGDLYDFEPTLRAATPGDISLCVPSKIMRSIWNAMKLLDTIVPGILHPSTIMYYPEIKHYANKPAFIDKDFLALPDIYLAGDGAGTSRGIVSAWASGMRVARGVVQSLWNQ